MIRKKLIEVALPLEAINVASAREKSIRHGHPSTLHLWWARRPLAACRAVLFGQLVDDPSSWPDVWRTDEEQEVERKRLFTLIESMVQWENSNDEGVIHAARVEVARSLARGRLADGSGDERDEHVLTVVSTKPRGDGRYHAPEMRNADIIDRYLAEVAPPVHDPFAGGGSIPLEAQRLGLRAIATDLNPVAVLINKALIEIPPKFAGWQPVNPESRRNAHARTWKGAQGLAEDVRYYGKWMRDEAFKRIGHSYPNVDLPTDKGGGKATVIAWLWARTVASPNPACRGAHVPLVSSYWLSKKQGREAWVEPVVDRSNNTWRFEVRTGKPSDTKVLDAGTKTGRGAKFSCILSGEPIPEAHLKEAARGHALGTRLFAIVAAGNRERIFLPASRQQEEVALGCTPRWSPDLELPNDPRNIWCANYGFSSFKDLFSGRQALGLTTFIDLMPQLLLQVTADVHASGCEDVISDQSERYAQAVATYCGLAISKAADLASTICHWQPNAQHLKLAPTLARQTLPMSWDFAEGNPFSDSSGNYLRQWDLVAEVLDFLPVSCESDVVVAQDVAQEAVRRAVPIFCTDPPYYDNISYANLSDYFYTWLRPALRSIHPAVFGSMATPKSEELVASPERFGGSKKEAGEFFEVGLRKVFRGMNDAQAVGLPVTVFYAFKQSESSGGEVSSTGWETMLGSLLSSGFSVTGTVPMATERPAGLRVFEQNALATSIVLVCRKRLADAPSITRADFRRLLRQELPAALKALQHGNIAPVDMAQASIGPGMAIYSRHAKVLEADGSAMGVRTALQLINQALDEYLAEQDGEFDPDTRFAVTWFDTRAFDSGAFGEAETLAKARNVSVQGVVEAGILLAAAGKVRLLRRDELPADWDPTTDKRPTVWEATQHLIKRMDDKGEIGAAALLAALGTRAAPARDLAYRLYTVCERKGWAEEARAYNGLVIAWPELEKLAGQVKIEPGAKQRTLF